jgi:hypothetical protein
MASRKQLDDNDDDDDVLSYMTHSQMLGKFEYALPAKF